MFEGMYEIDQHTGCWNWKKAKNPHGYGIFRDGRSNKSAHRAVYEAMVAPVERALHVDHLCFNKSCVNPAHLEPVTPAENARRHYIRYANVDVCREGHPKDGVKSDRPHLKYCRVCNTERRRESRSRSRNPQGELQ